MSRAALAIIFVSFLVMIAVISCRHSPKGMNEKDRSTQTLPKWITSDDVLCEKDGDCIVIAADCCGCHQGGKQTAINQDFEHRVKAAKAHACAETLCVQMLSRDPSCKAKNAQCVNNRCAISF